MILRVSLQAKVVVQLCNICWNYILCVYVCVEVNRYSCYVMFNHLISFVEDWNNKLLFKLTFLIKKMNARHYVGNSYALPIRDF